MQNLLTRKMDDKGQMQMVGVAIGMIVTLMIGIIVINQLFLSGAGPTDNVSDPDYNADALAAWNNTRTYSWIAIGLMSIGIVILGAVTVLSFIQPLMGRGRA